MESKVLEAHRAHSIIGGFYEVYNYYGYELVESVYAGALEYELSIADTQLFVSSPSMSRTRVDTSHGNVWIWLWTIESFWRSSPEPCFLRLRAGNS